MAAILPAKAWEPIRLRDSFPFALVTEPAAQAGAYMYAGTSLPYPGDYGISDAQLPDSLQAVFVNHVGRHGARFLTSPQTTHRLLDYLDSCDTLSPVGRNVLWLCHTLDSVTAGCWGALDEMGREEQDSIGARLARRFPGLFSPGDSVAAVASFVPRCVASMDAMTHALVTAHPRTELSAGSGPRFSPLLRFFDSDKAYRAYRDSGEWEKVWQGFVDSVCPVEPVLRLGSGPRLGDARLRSLSMDLYKAVSGAMCILDRIDWRPFFLENEYARLWECANLKHYLTYSANGLSRVSALMARPLCDELRLTLEEAAAPGYSGPKAILRFGHAETLMPLFSLLDLPRCRYVTDKWGSVADNWQDSNVATMAANLQIVLCRAEPSGNLYVKVYLNESPVLPLMTLGKALEWLNADRGM